ncbi:MAG: zinc ribbon domain-containing protein [Euryarchaeota archaeon]|nr:zinc ribbon domain-containing protein [Euryarchaeota archaeon]
MRKNTKTAIIILVSIIFLLLGGEAYSYIYAPSYTNLITHPYRDLSYILLPVGFTTIIIGIVFHFITKEDVKDAVVSFRPTVCDNCKKIIPHESKFCPECGVKFAELQSDFENVDICGKCGEKAKSDAKFCLNCGATLRTLKDLHDW